MKSAGIAFFFKSFFSQQGVLWPILCPRSGICWRSLSQCDLWMSLEPDATVFVNTSLPTQYVRLFTQPNIVALTQAVILSEFRLIDCRVWMKKKNGFVGLDRTLSPSQHGLRWDIQVSLGERSNIVRDAVFDTVIHAGLSRKDTMFATADCQPLFWKI